MKYKIILFLIALSIISSAILSFIPIEQACQVSVSGCYKVQSSDYETTFGMKNAHLGLVAFTILFIITAIHTKKPTKQTKKLILYGLITASAIAIYFIYLQLFIIHAICYYCMTIDISTIIALTIMLIKK